jgi:hypothetical protein
MIKKYFTSIKQYANNSGRTMETGDHFKNGYMRIFCMRDQIKDIEMNILYGKFLKMTVYSAKIGFFVLSLTVLSCGNVLFAQDITVPKSGEKNKIKVRTVNAGSVEYKKHDAPFTLVQPDIPAVKYKTDNRYMLTVADTVNRQLRYTHNFQSGIPVLDNYLDIRILDGTGKKLKKSEIRSILADVPGALDKYNSGTRLYTTAAVLGIASIGILVVRLSNPEHKYLWMSIGIGCSTGVVICRLTGTAKLKSAINLHNGTTINRHAPNFSLNFGTPSSGGLGLMLNF